ncbi:DUF1776-domain-containing protein [Trichoderma longibrachiatum ATCC 18648]|uniref:DUF1776-domain-containing protein n=1 Tax=Trichoderma longibrachiatum ATCC 18648 TaxID=983965 RepID=A0A2T4BXT2_TRILO|nr:DUF1776-domain-containing protein [Trichoderma longibrachiatum ATCC 18648]
MASDGNQQVLDVLSTISGHFRRVTDNAAEFIDKGVDKASEAVRERLATVDWLPDIVKPLPPPKPEVIVVPLSTLEKLQGWFARNKYLIGAAVVITGTVAYKGYQQNKYVRKVRRAKRSKNGGRSEVIVIAGSPRLPLTKTLALDMERRGFIVFIVCNAVEDEAALLPPHLHRTVRIGLGASIYGFVGRWAPRSLVSWMMGIRKVDELSTWKTSSYEGSEDGSDDGEDGPEGSISESKEFIAVQSDDNVWGSGETAKWEQPPVDVPAP